MACIRRAGAPVFPEEFGVVNIATVVIAFFAIFSDLGIGPAVIQHKNLDKRDLGGIFAHVVVRAFMALLFAGIGADRLVLRRFTNCATSCAYSHEPLFAAANIVPNGLILKEKRFRFAAVRSLRCRSSAARRPSSPPMPARDLRADDQPGIFEPDALR